MLEITNTLAILFLTLVVASDYMSRKTRIKAPEIDLKQFCTTHPSSGILVFEKINGAWSIWSNDLQRWVHDKRAFTCAIDFPEVLEACLELKLCAPNGAIYGDYCTTLAAEEEATKAKEGIKQEPMGHRC